MWQEVLIVSHEYFISCDRCQISWNVFFCDRFSNRNFHFVTGIFSLWQEISVSDQFCSSYKRKFILMTRICFLYRRSIFILNYCLWYVSTQYDRKCLPVIENLSSFDVQFCTLAEFCESKSLLVSEYIVLQKEHLYFIRTATT